jgi:hypothetical protein
MDRRGGLMLMCRRDRPLRSWNNKRKEKVSPRCHSRKNGERNKKITWLAEAGTDCVCVHTLYTHTHTTADGRTDGARELTLLRATLRELTPSTWTSFWSVIYFTHTHTSVPQHTQNVRKEKKRNHRLLVTRGPRGIVWRSTNAAKKKECVEKVCVCVRERELDSELRSQTTIHLGATCKRWRDALAPYRRQLLLLYIAHTPIHTHRDIYVCVCEQASKLSHSTHTHTHTPDSFAPDVSPSSL